MNYTKVINKSTLINQISTTSGIVLDTLVHQEQVYKKKKANYKGIRRISMNIIDDIIENGNVYLKVLGYTLKNVNKNNELYKNTKIPMSITDLALQLNISRSKVSTAVNLLIKQNKLKKKGRTIVLSPYLYVPYNTSDDKLFILQTWWDSDFTYDITEELEEANRLTEEYIKSNKPKEEIL